MTNGEENNVFTFDSLESVHDDIQEASPLPNEPAIAAHGEETATKLKAASGALDKQGVKFDPAIHAVNADGEPSKTPLGKFRRKRGTSKVESTSKALVTEQKKAQARAAGNVCADALIGSCIMFLGPEWQPIGGKEIKAADYDERQVLRAAFADYFEAKNFTDFPPGLAFSLILSAYMVPRFTAGKETKTRLKKAKNWFSEKWTAMQDKRKEKHAAQPDTRNNGKRKDDASETNGSPKQTERTGSSSPRPDAG